MDIKDPFTRLQLLYARKSILEAVFLKELARTVRNDKEFPSSRGEFTALGIAFDGEISFMEDEIRIIERTLFSANS